MEIQQIKLLVPSLGLGQCLLRFCQWNCLSTRIFAWLVRVWASRDTTLLRTIFRAVSEQFQSSFRAVSEQFQSSFRAVSEQFFFTTFNSPSMATIILGYGNSYLVSGRWSLERHYLFTYYFHSSFRAVSEQFFFSRAQLPMTSPIHFRIAWRT